MNLASTNRPSPLCLTPQEVIELKMIVQDEDEVEDPHVPESY